MIPKAIALIGTPDTKGEEFSFLRDRIQKAGIGTIMIDVGTRDICMMSSVVDIAGLNRVPRRISAMRQR